MNLVEDYLANGDLSEAPVLLREFRPAGSVLVTPRYPDSRHVVILLLDESGDPRVVGKVVRRPDDRSTLALEAGVLQSLGAGAGQITGVPRFLGFADHKDHWMLFETALSGQPLTHRHVRRHPARAWRMVDEWICSLPVVSTTAECSGWFDDQIASPVQIARAALPPTRLEQQLFSSTLDLVAELVSADLPVPIEHGDLSHPNLLVSPRSSIVRRRPELSVIDWETGRAAGLVGADAAVFLAFVAFAVDNAHGPDAEAASYSREFLRDEGRGRRRLVRHLERRGVDPGLVDLILLATWSRYALSVFPRMSSGEQPRSEPDRVRFAREAFRAGRPLRLWQLTLERIAG
jgi:aminoglycoside phosphotransferase